MKLTIKAILCQLKEFVIKLFSLTTNYNLSKLKKASDNFFLHFRNSIMISIRVTCLINIFCSNVIDFTYFFV
jgi:hypothetical protein